MKKSTIALLPTDLRVPGFTAPFRDVLRCENRPRASGAKTTSVPVYRHGTYTVAACGHWGLAVALVRARLEEHALDDLQASVASMRAGLREVS